MYCVLLLGERFLLKTEEGFVPHGFYRNEYVFAFSREKAVSRAIERAKKKLQKNDMALIEGEPLRIVVEEVKLGMPIWRLFRDEGFIFFREEKAAGP